MAALNETDRRLLRRALALAQGGRGAVSPNPLVGAVIAAAEGTVIGEGFHAAYGERHAEVAAIDDVRRRGGDPVGATIYVTLEPCAHHAKQPPCADAVAEAGLCRVVIGADDPSGHADGTGPARLRERGIVVDFADGAEAHDSRLLVQPFRKRARTGRPLVRLKSALSLDGRTATASGDSRWISGEASRAVVHAMRAELDAVAVGIGTVDADDPTLTARQVGAIRQPARVVFDATARLPLHSKLVRSLDQAPLIVVCERDADPARVRNLEAAGVAVILAPGSGPDQIVPALGELGGRGISSLLLEGGATLAGAFVDAGEVDEAAFFIAPLVLGGARSRPVLGGVGVGEITAALRPLAIDWQPSGEDMLALARFREW